MIKQKVIIFNNLFYVSIMYKLILKANAALKTLHSFIQNQT